MILIDDVVTYTLRVPLRRPIADAIYHRTHWNIPVVEVRTSDGLTGTGISGVWAGEDLLLQTIDTYIAPTIMGRDPSEIGRLWSEVYWSQLHWVGRAGIAHMAQGMVDIALWDLAAQRAEVPLWKLLGGRHRELATYNTDGGWLNLTADELVADVERIVASGWTKVKMKVGARDTASDLDRVSKVVASMPRGAQLMVDANQRWDLVTARRMTQALADMGVAWIEEPLHPDDIAGHAALVRRSRIPVALGENVYSLEVFDAFLRADAVDIVQVDVTRVGGITEWLRVAQHAQAYGRWVVPHAGDMMQVHQHLVAGIGADEPAMIEYLPWAEGAYREPVEIVDGRLYLPDAPGASTAIDPEARAKWGTTR